MTPASTVYRDLAYVFTAAVVGALAVRKLRQPLIIGYVLGGILIGPFTPGPTVSEFHVLELFAEIGVILLMYTIGMEFSWKDLATVKWVSLIGGPLGIAVIVAMTAAVGALKGWSPLQSIAIGASISLASTMVLTRLLLDRGEIHTVQGRAMVGITLVDDLVFVLMLVLIPSLATLSGGRLWDVGVAFAKGIAILVPVALLAVKVIPPFMARVAGSANQELRLLIALAVGFCIAAFTQALGLSLALGAFLAGMIVSESDVADDTLTDLLPLRNAFTALFFVSVGALIDPKTLVSNPLDLATIVGLIVVGKFLIWTAVVWLFRYPRHIAVLVGVGLTQIGEFSFVLVQAARDARLVDQHVYSATLAASLVTILINAFLMRTIPELISRSVVLNEEKNSH